VRQTGHDVDWCRSTQARKTYTTLLTPRR
jgi:hypothetical protein